MADSFEFFDEVPQLPFVFQRACSVSNEV
ncbi:hypothetical protein J2X61_004285 [Bacillus sp. 3255]|nr:hypothetical protein [Bacillus sp. 3255]